MNKRRIGAVYERQAAEYLKSKGYQILENNYRCRIGEIDLIARDGRYLVFVEVKYRSDGFCGNALEAVTVRKQHTIRRVAQFYLLSHHLSEDIPCRFDVVGITGTEITLVKDAF